jgi:hypothetical protein
LDAEDGIPAIVENAVDPFFFYIQGKVNEAGSSRPQVRLRLFRPANLGEFILHQDLVANVGGVHWVTPLTL